MSQLITLLWLKWKLFRNSLRTAKAVANRLASLLVMLAALALALLVAFGLGAAAYALTSPAINLKALERSAELGRAIPSAEFIFFSILSMSYLLWATLPLTMGASRQFDPRNLLQYPISLRKLFAFDFVSEIASLQSIFAIPVILAIGIGAGLAQNRLFSGFLISLVAVAFGLALTKSVSVSIGSLLRKRRTRGETLLALMGAAVGLVGILFAQVAETLIRHAETIRGLRWTPPGALAFALTDGLKDDNFIALFLVLMLSLFYTALLVLATYWLARRAISGSGKVRKRLTAPIEMRSDTYTGWQFPFLSPVLSAVTEKELRYVLRNAQLRMMALMPVIIIIVRVMNRRRLEQFTDPEQGALAEFWKYGETLITTGSILYVFLILTGLSCNLFAFEQGGMRTIVLAPVDRKYILIGKNITIGLVALVLSMLMLVVSHILFGDITAGALLFAALTFLIYASLTSMIGNWLSIYFPKRMKMGSRMNVSGVVGLLLIPMIALMTLPPLAAVAAGYVAKSLMVEYVTLALLAAITIGMYFISINSQGQTLEARELRILEAVTDADDE